MPVGASRSSKGRAREENRNARRETPAPRAGSHRLLWILLFAATFAAFSPALRAGFLNWDDDKNFVENEAYRGFAPSNVRWMFSTFHMGHYQPLSWLSLAFDHLLWVMDPRGYHLTNLILHALNAVAAAALLAALLRAARRARSAGGETAVAAAAALGALFYALHPLRTESVAWITERRDLLSALFLMLAARSYVRAHGERSKGGSPGIRFSPAALVFFALSLLSKAWGMTFPAVLLLLDVYPLRRRGRESTRTLIVEKLPYAALAALAAALAIAAQRASGALLSSLGEYTAAQRLAQSAYGLLFYLVKTAAPVGLSPLYLLDMKFDPSGAKYLASGAFAIAATALCVLLRRRAPWLLAAWAAYVVTISPVLGWAQSGVQAVADRYTYLAALPWAALAAAGARAVLESGPKRAPLRRLFLPASAAVLAVLAALSFVQAGHWKDSIRLFTHAIRLDPRNDAAYNNRGLTYFHAGDPRAALADLDACLAINPGYAEANANRAAIRQSLGDSEGAVRDLTAAIALDPERADFRLSRGVIQLDRGDPAAAVADLDAALARDPSVAAGYLARGRARQRMGEPARALPDLDRAVALDPGLVEAFIALGGARLQLGDAAGALREFARAAALTPEDESAYIGSASARERLGDFEGAARDYGRALDLAPVGGPERGWLQERIKEMRARIAAGG